MESALQCELLVYNALSVKNFHGVLAGNVHECLLKPSIGKVRKERSKTLDKKTLLEEPSNRCFSKTITMHNLVIGLFINHYEFGLLVCYGINSSETPSNTVIRAGIYEPTAFDQISEENAEACRAPRD